MSNATDDVTRVAASGRATGAGPRGPQGADGSRAGLRISDRRRQTVTGRRCSRRPRRRAALLATVVTGLAWRGAGSLGAQVPPSLIGRELLPPQVKVEPFAGPFSGPVALAFLPDGRLLVTEKNGGVRLVAADGQAAADPILSLPTDQTAERGLLGVAADPGFAQNQRVFVYHTLPRPSVNRIVRFRLVDGRAVAPTAVYTLPAPGTIHNAGNLHFGPDGQLYVGVGEGARRRAPATWATRAARSCGWTRRRRRCGPRRATRSPDWTASTRPSGRAAFATRSTSRSIPSAGRSWRPITGPTATTSSTGCARRATTAGGRATTAGGRPARRELKPHCGCGRRRWASPARSCTPAT